MSEYMGRKAIMRCDIPEIKNLFEGDTVVIQDEKWVGEGPLRIRQFRVRSLIRNGVQGLVNESDLIIGDEILW